MTEADRYPLKHTKNSNRNNWVTERGKICDLTFQLCFTVNQQGALSPKHRRDYKFHAETFERLSDCWSKGSVKKTLLKT